MLSSKIPLQGEGISEDAKCANSEKGKIHLLVMTRQVEKISASSVRQLSSRDFKGLSSFLIMSFMVPWIVSTLKHCILETDKEMR